MTMSPRARSAIAVAALLATGLLAGCDDEDDPPEPTDSVSEPTSPSSSTTTGPTPTGPVEPTQPTDAEPASKSGATAFVGFYWDVVTYARQTGDVALLKTLSVPSCSGCNGGIRSIEQIYDRGGRIVGGAYSLISADPGRTPSGAWHVSSRVKVHRSRTVGAGNLNQNVKSGELGFLVGLAHENGSWRVTFLDVT